MMKIGIAWAHKNEEGMYMQELGDISGQNILDLACGAGYSTRLIKNKGANMVIGVDISQAMIVEGIRLQKGEPSKSLEIDYVSGAVWQSLCGLQ